MFLKSFSLLMPFLLASAAVADENVRRPDSVEWKLAGYSVVGIVRVTPERYSRAILEKNNEHETVRVGENLGPGLRVTGMDNHKVLLEYRSDIVGLLLRPSSATSANRYASTNKSRQNGDREKPGWVEADSRHDSGRSHNFVRQRAAAARQRITSKRDPEMSPRSEQSIKLDEIRDPEKFRGLIDKDRR